MSRPQPSSRGFFFSLLLFLAPVTGKPDELRAQAAQLATIFKSDLRFQHLTIADSRSQGTANAIHQDRLGFMRFGTKAGLNRYVSKLFNRYS